MKHLERIGAQFGACQNAYTTTDETVSTFALFFSVSVYSKACTQQESGYGLGRGWAGARGVTETAGPFRPINLFFCL